MTDEVNLMSIILKALLISFAGFLNAIWVACPNHYFLTAIAISYGFAPDTSVKVVPEESHDIVIQGNILLVPPEGKDGLNWRRARRYHLDTKLVYLPHGTFSVRAFAEMTPGTLESEVAKELGPPTLNVQGPDDGSKILRYFTHEWTMGAAIVFEVVIDKHGKVSRRKAYVEVT